MNFGSALDGIFYAFMFAVVSALILALYVFWQTFFSLTPWEVCVKMETDAAKVQCMEAHYDD
jgi:succinate dehydrogenase hydrophobic anchor subunit